MSSKKAMEDIEIGDLVIVPHDEDREYRPVVSTEADQVFGEKKCGYYVTVRGIIEPHFGYEDETLPYMEPSETE